MRIISNFKDYYDSVQIHGIDKTKQYIRTTISNDESSLTYNKVNDYITSLTGSKLYSLQLYNKCTHKYKVDKNVCVNNFILLFFCGKIYPLSLYNVSNSIVIVKSVNQLDNIIHEFGNKELINKWLKIKNYSFYFKSMLDEYNEFFSIKENNKINDLFYYIDCPCFYMDFLNKQIILNPRLKDLEFYTIKDSFTAYQEITMYIDNFLARPKEIIEISDKIKIDKHGYNKWSFRKEPIN